MRVAFAGFIFDSDTREIYRGQRPLTISPKAFELLDLLIRNRPRALSKSEIHLRPGFIMKSFDVSSDGKQILFDRYRENADVVLIDLPPRLATMWPQG